MLGFSLKILNDKKLGELIPKAQLSDLFGPCRFSLCIFTHVLLCTCVFVGLRPAKLSFFINITLAKLLPNLRQTKSCEREDDVTDEAQMMLMII